MNWTIVDLPFGPILGLPPDLPPGERGQIIHIAPSFRHDIGVRAGMLLELADGHQYLVGDINTLGGVCDDCRMVTPEDVIHRYAVVWEPET